jgi:MSHA biogenesis protein MshJ
MSLQLTQSAQWQQALEKFEALSKRERWLVFLAGLVAIGTLLNMLLISPVTTKQKTLASEIAQSQTQMATLGEQLNLLKQNPQLDADTQNGQKIAQLTKDIQQQRRALTGMQHDLISPESMPEMLGGLLQKNTGIRLLAMKTLPSERILLKDNNGVATDKPAGAEASTEAGDHADNGQAAIYKHGVELTIAGQYFDLMRYVQALEHLPMRVMWSKADFRAKEFPQSELTITVYTLSLDKTWLSI